MKKQAVKILYKKTTKSNPQQDSGVLLSDNIFQPRVTKKKIQQYSYKFVIERNKNLKYFFSHFILNINIANM